MYNGVYTAETYAYMHDTLMKWLKGKLTGESLGEKLLQKNISKVAVYGANELGQMVCRDVESAVTVVGYIDKNKDKFQGMPGAMQVFGLEQLELLPADCYVLVTPEIFFREIMEDLTDRGIGMERIISLAMVV
jgi:hypothetical protein